MNKLRLILPLLFYLFVSSNVLLVNSCRAQQQANKITATKTNQENSNQVSSSSANTSFSKDIRKWIPPTFSGIKLGVSTEEDVKKLFGKPSSEYQNSAEDKVFDNDREEEIVLDYLENNQANGRVIIIFGKKTKIVKAVSLYPGEITTMKQAISEYGSNFFQIESWESICIEEKMKEGVIDKSAKIPFGLVYPSRGMLVDIRTYNNEFIVGRIDYLVKCQ